jgi:Zn-dependent peptidase ImmA (M78 family)/DNA-binding XRE family transcriptional regulator
MTSHGQLQMFDNSNAEFRDRVKRLRLVRRWDQHELARRAGTSATVISQIEQGRTTPTSAQIAGIASALGYSPEYLTAELNLLPTTRPWLRAYADASKREADARTASATVAAEYIRRLDLSPLPNLLPAFKGELDDDDAIEEAAADVRVLADLDEQAVVANAIRAAERLGCIVLPLESELGRHLGMSVRADQLPIVCVAKDDVPGDRQRWTVAHELGHLVLHGQSPPPRDAQAAARMEKQAHRFAAAFLGPGDALIETLREHGGKVTLRALAEVKAVWGIAIKALVGRFQSLGLIDAEHARSLYKQISARKWTKDEPVKVPTESAQWLQRSMLHKAKATDLVKAAEQLAGSIGGNASDLFELANWTPRPEAQVLSLAGRQRRAR